MALLSALDSYFVSHAYFTTLLKGASVQIVFGFEVPLPSPQSIRGQKDRQALAGWFLLGRPCLLTHNVSVSHISKTSRRHARGSIFLSSISGCEVLMGCDYFLVRDSDDDSFPREHQVHPPHHRPEERPPLGEQGRLPPLHRTRH